MSASIGLPRKKPSASFSTSCVKEGPPDKVQALIDSLPGAEALLQAQQAGDAGGGMFGMGGLMGAGTKMMAAGLSMGQVQGVTREVDRLCPRKGRRRRDRRDRRRDSGFESVRLNRFVGGTRQS